MPEKVRERGGQFVVKQGRHEAGQREGICNGSLQKVDQ